MATMQAPKRLASLSQGRVALLDDTRDISVGALEPLMTTLRKHTNHDMFCKGIGVDIRHIACTQDEEKGHTPQRDILEMLLCAIDKLLRGSGTLVDLRNGTSRLYDDTHLHPRRAIRGMRTYLVNEYTHIDLGYYGRTKPRARIRVPMHRLMCWLRWGNPSKDSKATVCHDPHCPRRDCVSLVCLRWGDDADNARDRAKECS